MMNIGLDIVSWKFFDVNSHFTKSTGSDKSNDIDNSQKHRQMMNQHANNLCPQCVLIFLFKLGASDFWNCMR